jgi:hypothetical protein
MTFTEATLTSAAREVTLYLAVPSPLFLAPRSSGPAASLSPALSLGRRRSSNPSDPGRPPPHPQVPIRVQKLLDLGDQGPGSLVRSIILGRRRRGLSVSSGAVQARIH